MSNDHRTPNKLVTETSPYLLQHAYNPVQWYPWSEEALEKARQEDKPIIVSIGYSSCHWCHVMEHESFEDEEVAEVMNSHFVCIKIDREERPDIDQIYMEAVQIMGLHGGWPLNVLLMPDTKPFYGGTYFPKQKWISMLGQVAEAFTNHRDQLSESAQSFANSLKASEATRFGLTNTDVTCTIDTLDGIFSQLSKRFDSHMGGMNKEPKFPMPSIWSFVHTYYQIRQDPNALAHLNTTLQRMAQGGIHDQIGGGFSRYSVDGEWFAPHFEKMLYDNGQLLSLYTHAYKTTNIHEYKTVCYSLIKWLSTEMTHANGGFYSALDADSEGVEGKFYCWTWDDLSLLFDADELPLLCAYYHIHPGGNWEHDLNILFRKQDDNTFCQAHNLSIDELENLKEDWKKTLLSYRASKIRPGLDNKIILGWNALMLKGLCDAYEIFEEPSFLALALNNARFIEQEMYTTGEYMHTWRTDGKHTSAFHDDLSLLAEGYISLYQITFDEIWLSKAKSIAQYCIDHFFDPEESLFYYTSHNSESLIARKKELFDNVISCSNSTMAKVLYLLGRYEGKEEWMTISNKMLARVSTLLDKDPSFLANWAELYAWKCTSNKEVAISGKDAIDWAVRLKKIAPVHTLFAATTSDASALSVFEQRLIHPNHQTLVYICEHQTCGLPIDSFNTAQEALCS